MNRLPICCGEDRRPERWRLAAVVVVIGVLVSPAVRDHDSFPLSTYPIYASARPREAEFITARGERADGSSRGLSMDVIARTDDPLIAASRVADAVATSGAHELCVSVAARAPHDVVAVVVVRERHDVVDAARGDDSLLSREELARCATTP